MTKKRKILSVFFLILLLLSGFSFADPVKLCLFSVPSGLIVSVLSGGRFLLEDGAAAVELPDVLIRLPASCSGTVFFLLLSLLMILYKRERLLWLGWIAGCFVNALRVLAVVFCAGRVGEFLPGTPEFHHQTAGLVIFLSALLAASVLLNCTAPEKKAEDSGISLEKKEKTM